MNGILSSLAGMLNAQRRLDVTAHNIANSQTEGYRAIRATSSDATRGGIDIADIPDNTSGNIALPTDGAEFLPPSNVNLTTEITNQIISKNAFTANLNMLKAQDDTLGSLFDILD